MTQKPIKIDFSVVPGFKPLDLEDFPNCEVLIGQIPLKDKTVRVEMVKSKKIKEGDFLPAKVYHNENMIWNFKDEDFNGLGELVYYKKTYYIALINRKREIVRVLPLEDLPVVRAVVNDEICYLGKTTPRELHQIKMALAKEMRLRYLTSPLEKKIYKKENELKTKQQEEQKELKEKIRKQRLQELLSRTEIFAFAEDGRKVSGVPATEDEWPSLPKEHPVVLVESYDQKTKTHGRVIEAFFVEKNKGGKSSKKKIKPVTQEKPNTQFELAGVLHVFFQGEIEQIPLVNKQEDIQRLTAKGLNSGTLVAVNQNNQKEPYKFFRLKKGEPKPLKPNAFEVL